MQEIEHRWGYRDLIPSEVTLLTNHSGEDGSYGTEWGSGGGLYTTWSIAHSRRLPILANNVIKLIVKLKW